MILAVLSSMQKSKEMSSYSCRERIGGVVRKECAGSCVCPCMGFVTQRKLGIKSIPQQLIQIDFIQDKASPRTFYHPTKHIRTYVHGDDYVSSGMPEDLEWMKRGLERKYHVKSQILGPWAHAFPQMSPPRVHGQPVSQPSTIRHASSRLES